MDDIGTIIGRDGSLLLKMWNVSVPSGKREFRKHNHIYFEISLVESGSGIYKVGSNEYGMSEGDIFIFASNESHCITDVGSNGLKIINLHFEPKYLWGNSIDSLSEESVNICFSHNKAFKNRIKNNDAIALKDILLKIKEELIMNEQEYQLTVKSYLNLFLIKLIRGFNYTDKTQPLSRDKLHSIRRGIRYIDAHLCEKISLIEISESAGMSPNYFSSLFHSVSGITLWDYINSKRIDRATYLLHSENMNILDIALACGFNNTANFNKAFKKHTGMTPKEYKYSSDIMF